MVYRPKRYFSGLSKTQKKAKIKEMEHFGSYHWTNPKAYTGFKTDKLVKSKTSNYTRRFKKLYPEALSLEEKAKATGIPVRFLREVYNRGMAAWRTGHRPGATEQQWGYARVHSFVLKGKTYHTADSDIARKVDAYLKGK
jgi:DNA invertase Pin-like site-specific DNA recombinase